MSEKFTPIERVVGKGLDEPQKQSIRDKYAERFEHQDDTQLSKLDREKTPEELKIVKVVHDATNELRRKYGLEEFTIPEKMCM